MEKVNNTFKKKFNLILIGSLSLLVVLGVVIILTIFSIRNNVDNNLLVSETSTKITLCQSSMRGFLLNALQDTVFVRTGTNEAFEKFNKEADNLMTNLQALKQGSSDEEDLILTNTEKICHDLQTHFKGIAELMKERGFKNIGLEGVLRESVHKLENTDLLADKSLVLKLRKNEKDFFMRKDVKYLDAFEKESHKLEAEIVALPESAEKDELQKAFNTYIETFNKIVVVETKIGLSATTGLRGEINKLISEAMANLTSLDTTFDNKTQSLINTAIGFIAFIFVIIILAVMVSLNKLIKPVFAPMQDIQMKAGEISEGNLSVQFDEHRDNAVLKELIEGFEKIIHKFKTTMNLVEGISARQILQELPIHSDSDEVGSALNKIIVQIKQIDEEEKRRTWHNEGLAKFASILRINDSNESAMYDSIISELVRYLNGNQGALFIIEGEEDKDAHLSMKGCYAYNRKKFLDMRIEHGEGLAGMCWAEAQSIYITDIPSNYVRITSGTGEATPTSVVIVPIKFNDKVQGIIEIASFSEFEEYQIKYIETLAESIGSAIHNLKTNVKTLNLLQRSQEMTEELRAQEEEMRQNMEELQATQEEMERMSSNLKNEVELLRQENEEYKNQLLAK